MSGKEELTVDGVPVVYKVSVDTHVTYNFVSNIGNDRQIREEDLPREYAELLERFFNMRQAYNEIEEKLECVIDELNRRPMK